MIIALPRHLHEVRSVMPTREDIFAGVVVGLLALGTLGALVSSDEDPPSAVANAANRTRVALSTPWRP